MKTIAFQQVIADSIEKEFDYVLERDIDFPLESQKIITFIGVRRCGKTHVMYQAINKLRKNMPRENIVYVNFEDDRIFPLTLPDASTLLNAYYELFPQKKSEKVVFFFDEIQILENWAVFIRRLYDTENCQIFLSGSSSKLLSSEIATNLRGRTLTFEVFPLSFKEFLRFHNVTPNIHSSKSIAHIRNLLNTYVQYGGFPELVFEEQRFIRKTLQDYVDLIIYKDLIERYKIGNHYVMKYLVKYCFSNISTLFSPNKLFNDMKSLGIQLSKNTLYEYMSYLEDAFAVFSVPMFSRSVAEQSKNPKKIYAVDTGFKTASSFVPDIGHRFENIVFLQLRRTEKELFYVKQKQETDFYCLGTENPKLINVAYNLEDAGTLKREIGSLIESMTELQIHEAELITAEREETMRIDDKTIRIVPLWKWLLT